MLVLLITAVTGAWATITVTINQSDWGVNYSFTKDGVTVSAAYIDRDEGDIKGGGTFSTTLGNFTKIVVTADYCQAYGEGWSGGEESMTWAGTPASTVSFGGDFDGMGETQTTIVCTIEPATVNACGDGVTWALDNGVLTISYAGSGTGAMADFTESWESNPIPWKDNLYDITSIVIEEGVTSIGKMAFKDCDMLTSVSIPATVTSIGENAFANSGSPSGMTVTIAAGSALETIGTYAFMRSNLASINLPNGVTTIGDFAFAVCEKLASFTWPSSLTSIGMRAFQGTALTTVEIPATLTSIGDYAFMACSSLATITVADGNSAYEAPNGCNALIDKNSHTLIQGCSGTVFEILPADLTTIGHASCSYFGFTSVTIPDGVTTIGEHAFEGCSDLTTVEIPASVTSIGELAFGWCGSLATVTVYAEPTCALGDEAFYDCSSLAAIYVPSDKVNDFKTATGWSAYESIIDAIPAPATYTVSMKESTEDATSWQGKAGTGDYQELPLEGVAQGAQVSLKYGGALKVKSVKAKKKASAPTLKDALADGATVVINYTWMGTNITTFTYTNNGGNYTGSTTGDDAEYFANGMSVDGTTLRFTASNPDISEANVSIDFDTDTNEYAVSKGSGFTSFTISVNGTDLTSQLTKVK